MWLRGADLMENLAESVSAFSLNLDPKSTFCKVAVQNFASYLTNYFQNCSSTVIGSGILPTQTMKSPVALNSIWRGPAGPDSKLFF